MASKNLGIQISVTPPLEEVGKAIRLIKLGAALQRGIQKFAFQVERFSKQQTPVDTGRLRASISTDIGNLYAKIAPHTVYAGWIHEGKMTRNGRTVYIKGRGRAHTPPGGKPFMELGLKQAKTSLSENEIINELNGEIRKAISYI